MQNMDEPDHQEILTVSPAQLPDDLVVIGRIAGLYGIKGWLKIISYTEPRVNVFSYSPWYLNRGSAWLKVDVDSGRAHNKGIIVKIKGCDDRTYASPMIDSEIHVSRILFPLASSDEYYWSDLQGLKVCNLQDEVLGIVASMMSNGVQDIMVVRGDIERLIPFVKNHFVISVDLSKKRVIVDWPLEYDD